MGIFIYGPNGEVSIDENALAAHKAAFEARTQTETQTQTKTHTQTRALAPTAAPVAKPAISAVTPLRSSPSPNPTPVSAPGSAAAAASTDPKRETYWVAPLCLLAYGDSLRDRFDAIIVWTVMEHAAHYAKTATPDGMRATLASLSRTQWPDELDPADPHHVGVAAAYKHYDRYCGSIPWLTQEREKLVEFVTRQEKLHGPGPFMRLRTDLFFEARNGNGITARELFVYAAINAALGRKKAAHVSHSRMRAGALGYKAGGMLFDERGKLHEEGRKLLATRTDGAQPLTVSQLRTTLGRLLTYGQPPLVSVCRPDRFHSYYSISMSGLELDEKVYFYRTNREEVMRRIAERATNLQKRIAETKEEQRRQWQALRERQTTAESQPNRVENLADQESASECRTRPSCLPPHRQGTGPLPSRHWNHDDTAT